MPKVLTFDEARRIALNVAKLPGLLGASSKQKKPSHKGQAPPFPSIPPRCDSMIRVPKLGKVGAGPKKLTGSS